MKIKFLAPVVIVVIVVCAFWIFKKKPRSHHKMTQTYKFAQLPKEQAALIDFKDPLLKEHSPLIISFEDILDIHYQSLVNKKEELFLASALEQFGVSAKKSILVGSLAPQRSVQQICNQYAFKCPDQKLIRFEGPKDYFLNIDGKMINRSEVKADSIFLKAAQSEVLDHLISKINYKLNSRLLYLVSKQQNLSVQDFIDQKIIKDSELKAWAEKVGSTYSKFPDEQKAFTQLLYQQHKDRVVTDYLIKAYVKTPIVVNIQRPQYDFETRWEWTPSLGQNPKDSSLHVVLFFDYFSQSSRDVLKLLLSYQQKDIPFTIGLRPLFPPTDRMQQFLTEYMFCAWKADKAGYFKLLPKVMTFKTDFTETGLDQIAQEEGLNLALIKKCAIARETKEAADYHLKTAQFLRLATLPALFIGQEVRLGPVSPVEFEQILNRQQ